MPKRDYLLPTRERITEARAENGSLLALAERGEACIDAYLQRCYDRRPDALRKRQTGFAGHAKGAAAWLEPYADAGVAHRCPHLAGDPEPQMEAVARIRQELGW